jgi:outer membrane biosynthesis protein TonB
LLKIGKIDKSIAASVALHIGVMGWGLVSFSTRALDAVPQESLPVDIISAEQLAQLTKGTKTGQKDAPKPLVEKVAEAKPVENTVGKIEEKKEIQAAAEKPPEPPTPKPVEKKPDPPKPPEPKVVEKKPEPKPEPKVDQIAEALKKEEAKKPPEKPKVEPPKPEQKQTKQEPPKQPPKERTFDASKMAALLDKRAPTRQAATGDTLNQTAALGVPTGQAQKLTMSWVGALQARIKQCWNVPAGVRDAENIEIRVYFELRKDGSVSTQPRLIAGPANAVGPAIAESAIRAIQQCQPYSFLPQAEYAGGWDRLDITFSSRDLFR